MFVGRRKRHPPAGIFAARKRVGNARPYASAQEITRFVFCPTASYPVDYPVSARPFLVRSDERFFEENIPSSRHEKEGGKKVNEDASLLEESKKDWKRSEKKDEWSQPHTMINDDRLDLGGRSVGRSVVSCRSRQLSCPCIIANGHVILGRASMGDEGAGGGSILQNTTAGFPKGKSRRRLASPFASPRLAWPNPKEQPKENEMRE